MNLLEKLKEKLESGIIEIAGPGEGFAWCDSFYHVIIFFETPQSSNVNRRNCNTTS
jgi:hypothetical protein